MKGICAATERKARIATHERCVCARVVKDGLPVGVIEDAACGLLEDFIELVGAPKAGKQPGPIHEDEIAHLLSVAVAGILNLEPSFFPMAERFCVATRTAVEARQRGAEGWSPGRVGVLVQVILNGTEALPSFMDCIDGANESCRIVARWTLAHPEELLAKEDNFGYRLIDPL